MFPQPSVKFQVRTLTYALSQLASAVVTSLIKFNIGSAVQVSVADGSKVNAVAIPEASSHSKVASKLPAIVDTVGDVAS